VFIAFLLLVICIFEERGGSLSSAFYNFKYIISNTLSTSSVPHPKIRLVYRVVTDSTATQALDPYFKDTYSEYNMRQQLFNSKFTSVKTFWSYFSL
jgi:hypothetical protein